MSLKTEFLQQFTKELILNSLPKEYLEELKKRKTEQRIIKLPIKQEILYPSIINQENMQSQHIVSFEKKANPLQNVKIEERNEESYYGDLYLGKLTSLVLDPGVINIECPGPEKYVSIKKMGKIMITKIILSKEEIQEIINSFSRESRIPIISGVFKAITSNMIITSIDSLSGPRFIISKINPRPSKFL